ncbi:nucleotide pyrophosphohydrolase [Cryptosporangium aurantiacum]|uniref:NTP pyrophosphatase, house-cleaning of non-canonical NTPs n=1 Tax=Cryptosporangium aurantiacum TaxID=134849 RepID=A0A1M7Q371_9ACTN|nr:nucleotide pyrophosphohydrolase [Cryptosporangium aurantiacum]SHN24738.1 NTP pyrophosphatase, house-cleaning of non-canonical NTPs [Cryptosporangium aurantiacum]
MNGDSGLAELTAATAEFAAAREWQPWHTPKNLVMALSGEVGELTALFQWLTPEESAVVMRDETVAADVRDEIADVMLYLVQLARVLDVDLVEVATAKLARNEHRFPALPR